MINVPPSQFKALQIPEPVDTQTSAINAQEAEAVSDDVETNPCFLNFSFTLLLYCVDF